MEFISNLCSSPPSDVFQDRIFDSIGYRAKRWKGGLSDELAVDWDRDTSCSATDFWGNGVLFLTVKWKRSRGVKRAAISMKLHFPNTCKDTGQWNVTILQLVVELDLLALFPHLLKGKPTAAERTSRHHSSALHCRRHSVAMPKVGVHGRTSKLGPTFFWRQRLHQAPILWDIPRRTLELPSLRWVFSFDSMYFLK